MDDLHYMATKGNCYFPDINCQKVIELKIKQLEITKFPFLYHLVTHNCFPIYRNYIVLTSDKYDSADSMIDIPLNSEFIFDYGDIKPEKEIKENKRRKIKINKITNKICNFKTIILFILLIAYICSIVTIFSSDRSMGLKIFGSVIDTYLIFLAYMAIHIFN